MNYLSEGFGGTALGIIQDIIEKISKGEKFVSKITGSYNRQSNTYLKGSITNYSKDLIMTFPMLCDDTLPIETASMISRANERYIISLLQMLFASETLQGLSGSDVISQIHRNIKSNMSLDDYIDLADEIDDNIINNFSEASEISRARRIFTESLKHQQDKRYPISSFSENSLNEYACINYAGKTLVTEKRSYNSSRENALNRANQREINRAKIKSDEKEGNLNRKAADDRAEADRNAANARAAADREAREGQFNRNLDFQKDKHNADIDLRGAKLGLDYAANARQNTSYEMDWMKSILVDSDVKKANELAPSLMIVKFISTVGDGSDSTLQMVERPFICGVKSRLIATEAKDIVERIISKNKTKLSFLNFIRATTGEIGFVKDFLLSLDQAKIDSKNAVKRGPAAKIWKTLEYRSTRNQKNMLKKSGNDASAITTLVINQETVNFMKKQYGFNLENIKNTRLILDSYNLLGIIICDETLESAKAFYAGNDSYEIQAYSYLEKESNDKSYKKVISLINQMNGR